MRIPDYLQRNRFGVYQFRRVVPPRLRAAVGKTEIIRSLRTREPREAARLARLIACHIDNLFKESEAIMSDKASESLQLDYTVEITFPDGTIAKTTTSPEDIAAMKDAGWSAQDVDAILHAPLKGLSSQAASPPSHAPAPAPTCDRSPLLSELIGEFNHDRIATKGGTWEVPGTDQSKLKRLVELLEDCPCQAVDRQTARHVRDQLLAFPSNTAGFRNQNALDILKVQHKDTLHPKTIKDHLDLYCRLFKWAHQEGHYNRPNPFEGLSPSDPTPKNKKRDSFAPEELKAIFSGPMFTQFDPNQHRLHHYWAPLIMLHSGLRTNEAASLEVSDIKAVKSGAPTIWAFDINTNNEKKSVKTLNAIRQVPIHQKLVDLGLIEYREQMEQLGHKRLFPYLKWDPTNGYGRYLGEHFTAYLKALGIHTGRKKVLYSFRHTLATQLERARVDNMRIERISGRSAPERKTTGQDYYITPAEADILYEDLMKVSFDEPLAAVRPFQEMVSDAALARMLKGIPTTP